MTLALVKEYATEEFLDPKVAFRTGAVFPDSLYLL